jgi:hypothetical protein
VPPVSLTDCNEAVIASALLAPQTAFRGREKYPSLESKVSALLYALAKSQACPDGNKRVALILVMNTPKTYRAEMPLANRCGASLDASNLDQLDCETAQERVEKGVARRHLVRLRCVCA